MGNAPRILLRIAAFFLTLAIICTISAGALAGSVSADEPDNLSVPPIQPAEKGEPEGSASAPPITRNSPRPVSQPPASQPPASQPPSTPSQPTAPASQPAVTTTMPTALPATGAGAMAARGATVRGVLNAVALISILVAATCASSGLAVARQRLGSSR